MCNLFSLVHERNRAWVDGNVKRQQRKQTQEAKCTRSQVLESRTITKVIWNLNPPANDFLCCIGNSCSPKSLHLILLLIEGDLIGSCR